MKSRYVASLFMILCGSATAMSDSEAVAAMAGALIAQANVCNLPTSPIEDSMNRWFNRSSVAQSERQRLAGVTAAAQRAMTGYTPNGGCSEVKRSIEDYRNKMGR